jgi:quercetin dioxygenase-like cupin family protein
MAGAARPALEREKDVGGLSGAVAAATTAAVLAACGSAAAPPSATASATPPPNVPTAVGAVGKVLSNAKVTTLPASPLYVSYARVAQAPQSQLPDGGETGFIYNLDGLHQLASTTGQSTDVNAGEGAYVDGAATASQVNPSSSQNTWYFVSLRPSASRSSGVSLQGAHSVCGTPNLPAFGPGTYDETLRLTTIAPGGRTQAHLHGGIEVICVLEGAMRVRIAGVGAVNLKAGQGTRILPGTPQQQFNDGTSKAVLLVYLITLDGVPFQTNLNTSP